MPKIVNREEKKQLIIEAAIHEFAANGVNNTKIVDIAKRANIGKGTVYEYFSSKESIFMEAMHFFMTSMNQTVVQQIDEMTDPGEKLIGLIDACIANANKFQDLLTIVLDFWAVGVRGSQVGAWREAYQIFQNTISQIIEEGFKQGVFKDIDQQYFSSLLIGMLDGIIFQVILFNKDYDLKRARDTAVNIVLNGIAV